MKCSAPVPQHPVHQFRKAVCSVLKILVILLAGFVMTFDVSAAAKPSLPSAPSGLITTALSSNQIQLTWNDNSSNESSFKIERALTASGSWKQIGTVTMNVTSYTSTGLAPATTYYFRVRAYNSRGNSGYTTVASATTFAIATALPCSYSISANSTSADASGAAGSVNVTAGANCAWTATANASWISILSGTSGAGNGSVNYSVASNSGSTSRVGTITIAGQTFSVTQAGMPAACNYSCSPPNAAYSADAVVNSVSVTAGTSCAWTATANDSWITVVSGNNGSGNGVVNYSLPANTSPAARTGSMTIAGEPFTVTQAGAASTLSLAQALDNTSLTWTTGGNANWITETNVFLFGGSALQSSAIGNGQISWLETAVTGPANLSFYWKVSSENTYDFLRFYVDGVEQSGSISGEVDWQQMNFAIAAGNHTLRWAYTKDPTCCAAGQDRGWLDQVQFGAPACSYVLTPTSFNHGAGAESGNFSVTALGCAWTASTLSGWIHTTSGGSGNGTITYSVDANTSTSLRSGTITVGGQTFTVNQAGITCVYSLNSSSFSHGAGVESGSFGISAQAGCSWTASTLSGWIHTTSGGSGNGTITYSVDANTSTSLRSGTITAGGQTFTVNQAGISCIYSLTSTSLSLGAGVGSSSFGITAQAGCSWAASTLSGWIHTTSGGSGNGTITYSVDANTSTSLRSGTITAGGQTFTVSQAGITCVYSLSSSSFSHGAGVESGSFGITAQAGCGWTASTLSGWIHTTSGGSGNGTITYSVDANTSTSLRSGTITAGGQTFTVNQAGISCIYSLTSTSLSLGAGVGSGSFGITAQAGCSWAASTLSGWIHTTSGGSGNGTITYSVDANTSTSLRSGMITAGGQTFTVNQAGITCVYSLSSSSFSHGAGVEAGSFGITAQVGCSWTASTLSGWIHTTSGGSGNGTVTYSVDANTSTSLRSGTITAGGQTFTVNQAGISCVYSLTSTSLGFGAGAGSGSFGITAQAGCNWTASTLSGWIHTTSGGNGNGTITYAVDANSSTSSRSGTVTAGGQTFTVNQAGITCVYSLGSSSFSHGAGVESGSFGITAQAGCSWTASSLSGWIHTTSGGSGNGTVTYSVDANTSTSLRSGTITAGGQTFTVSQAGITCVYSLSSSSFSHGAGLESGSFGIIAQAGCNWTASTLAGWIHTSSGGSGNGTVTYSVDANTSTSLRSGTITAGGQTFTVNQAGITCPYSLSSSSFSHGAGVETGSFGITAGAGCSWTASTPSSWIHTSSGGSGNGIVTYSVDANTSTSLRSGTIAVAGLSFTVNQAAAACTYTLNSSSASFNSAAASGNVNVTSSIGCGWTVASTGSAWIHCSSSGVGSGVATYNVDANSSAVGRSGTLNIAGQNFTVTQAGNLSPVANAGPNRTVAVGTTVAFSGSGSSDSDGTITTYNWSFGDLGSASGLSVSHAFAAAGTFTVALTVTDNLGASGSANATVIVTNATAPLTVSLTSPASGVTVSNTVNLAATASAAATRVDFYCDSVANPLGSATTAPFTFPCDTTAMPNGSHSFYCKAFDAAGNSTTSAANQVIVNNPVTIVGQCLLQRSFGGTAYGAGAVSKSTVVDRSGNLIVVGLMYYMVDFGAGAISSAGGQDAFVAKYAPNGQCLWSRRLGNVSDDTANGVAVDSGGNILVTGGFSGAIWAAMMDFGLGPVQCYGGSDIFLIKYSPTGSVLWSKVFGGSGSDVGTGVAVDSSDNILLTGTHGFFGTGADFGGGALPTYGQQDVFIAKLNSSGGYIWAQSYGGSDSDAVTSIAVDGSGNPVIAGQFRSTANFGTGNMTSAGDTDGYVGKYSGVDGSNLWFKRFGDIRGQSANGVAVDGSGNVFVTGDFLGTIDFGGTVQTAALGGSFYVAKYNSSGINIWSKSYGAESNGPHAAGVAVDGTGRVVVAGEMITGIDFGFGWLLGQGGNDAFVVKFDTNSTVLWAKRGSPYGDRGSGVTIDRSNNNIFVIGDCGTAGVDFGSQTVITTPNTSNNSYFLKISP